MTLKFFAKGTAKRGELYIYDAIGGGFWDEGITAQSVAEALAELKGVTALDVFIDSVGGIVHEGVAIMNQLVRFPATKKVHVDGLAASIASVIAMAGDEIVMGKGAMFMIHEPMGFAMGDAKDMRQTADVLDVVKGVIVDTYLARVGEKATRAQIIDWMAAETWMTAEQSVERGFADSICVDERATAASTTKNQLREPTNIVMLSKYKNTPHHLLPAASLATSRVGDPATRAKVERMQMRTTQLQRAAGASARAT